MAELINRVANSGLITLNLEDYFPDVVIHEIDIKDYLFQGLILKEKDFRAALKSMDWSQYNQSVLCVYCSADAIVPVWAYMLIAGYLSGGVIFYHGTPEQYLSDYYRELIDREIDPEEYRDRRIVIKGCSDRPVPTAAYSYLTEHLHPIAQSIMYGEACSTVPIWKRPRVLPTETEK